MPTSDLTYVTGPDGQVIRMPTRILVEIPSYKILAIGHEAREVEHAGVGESRVIQPFTSTEILDEQATQIFLKSLFQAVLGARFLMKPHVGISLNPEVSPFMLELWHQSVLNAGARDIVRVHPALAIATGVGLPVKDSHGFAIGLVDAELVQFGLVAFGHVQQVRTVPWSHNERKAVLDDPKAFGAYLLDHWRAFLASLPVDFVSLVQEEGCVLAWDEPPPAAEKTLSQMLQVPVVIVPRTVEVLGTQETIRKAR